MSLKEYWRKRKFEKTPEPKGEFEKLERVALLFTIVKLKGRKNQWLIFKTK